MMLNWYVYVINCTKPINGPKLYFRHFKWHGIVSFYRPKLFNYYAYDTCPVFYLDKRNIASKCFINNIQCMFVFSSFCVFFSFGTLSAPGRNIKKNRQRQKKKKKKKKCPQVHGLTTTHATNYATVYEAYYFVRIYAALQRP